MFGITVDGVIFVFKKTKRIQLQRFILTNSMVPELHTKSESLFTRIVCFGLRAQFFLQHMILLFLDGGLHQDMPAGKRGIADNAYKALNEITVHIEGHSKEMTNFINHVRA